MVRKELEVSSCRECPFANIDFEYGYNSCNHPDSDIELEDYIELPERTVHKECPLLDEDITIKLL